MALTHPFTTTTTNKETTMSDNTLPIPSVINAETLTKRAGTNVPQQQIEFDSVLWNIPAEFATNPMEAPAALDRVIRSQFEMVDVTEIYDGYTPDEIAIALQFVLSLCDAGVAVTKATSPFDSPSTRMVHTGYDWASQSKLESRVTDGAMSMPGFWGDATIRVMPGRSLGKCRLVASVARSQEGMVNGLFGMVRDYANACSIYLGQVIDSDFRFLDRTGTDPSKLAMTAQMKWAFDTYVRAPLMFPDQIVELGQDPKTGILFRGAPGGGKTITVETLEYVVARGGGCVVHVEAGRGLEGLQAASRIGNRLNRHGHLVMLVMEDMEKLGQLSDDERSKVLDIFDGADVKRQRRILIGTTNFLEDMETATYRAGRFSTVIDCGLPDRQAFQRVVELNIPADYLDGDIDWDAAFEAFDGYTYAFIANAANSLMLNALIPNDGDLSGFKVDTEMLVKAGLSQRDHFNMMSHVPEVKVPWLDQSMQELIAKTAPDHDAMAQIVEEHSPRTDYDTVYEAAQSATDSVLESRLDGAVVEKEDSATSFIRTN